MGVLSLTSHPLKSIFSLATTCSLSEQLASYVVDVLDLVVIVGVSAEAGVVVAFFGVHVDVVGGGRGGVKTSILTLLLDY